MRLPVVLGPELQVVGEEVGERREERNASLEAGMELDEEVGERPGHGEQPSVLFVCEGGLAAHQREAAGGQGVVNPAGPLGAVHDPRREALPEGWAARTERVRSYAIARFDVDALFSRVAQPPFTESSGAEAAYDALGQVARLLAGKGIRVIRGLGPAEVSALMRAVLSPDEDPDDITGCDGGGREVKIPRRLAKAYQKGLVEG